MVVNVDPCCCLSKSSNLTTSFVMRCCQKKLKACGVEECGGELVSEFLSRLPDQLLLEILIRLPSESSYRFKVVCKRWYSLISSGYFISRCISYRRQCGYGDIPSTFTLVFHHRVSCVQKTSLCMQHIEAVSNHPALSKFFEKKTVYLKFLRKLKREYVRTTTYRLPFDLLRFRVWASCYDLLLCSHGLTFCVVNLLTRKSVVIPPRPQRILALNEVRADAGFKPGLLCYRNEKSIIDEDGGCKFKLIVVPLINPNFSPNNEQLPPDLHSNHFNIDIYCSESRQWSVVNVDWYPLQLNSYRHFTPIIAHERMLHWLNGRSLVSLDAFSGDPQLSLSHTIDLPVPGKALLFGLCCGSIRVACRTFEDRNGPVILVWDLQGCCKKTWLLVHRVVLQKSSLKRTFEPLAFHPCDSDVFFLKKKHFIYSFNMRTGSMEEYHTLKLPKGYECDESVKNASVLLHQWFPTPVSSRPRSVNA